MDFNKRAELWSRSTREAGKGGQFAKGGGHVPGSTTGSLAKNPGSSMGSALIHGTVANEQAAQADHIARRTVGNLKKSLPAGITASSEGGKVTLHAGKADIGHVASETNSDGKPGYKGTTASGQSAGVHPTPEVAAHKVVSVHLAKAHADAADHAVMQARADIKATGKTGPKYEAAVAAEHAAGKAFDTHHAKLKAMQKASEPIKIGTAKFPSSKSDIMQNPNAPGSAARIAGL
ncbi:hypothetical protein UFOVP1519_60 [uncultured Caudovirales phage]|uniref:Uncharacterized protein n=1 Tax=uncultured Caudovirales phage TaxID=2100421 RepID=A0A6J5RJT7_9CAUD|nr:hypothetical protein UFOVP1306_4 [uncultured Caudovirales phage]CAB4210232.1 hypothetical protein UFOVP1422_6 [uncultured Caudovirales phage]CAB5227566.1 hypothetical protein UFOVP1519_60 [uncultured Caudovirales phage]